MCYGCTMCNKCGKFDHLLHEAARPRTCRSCGRTVEDSALERCPSCGAQLPPSLASLLGATLGAR